MNNMSPLVPRIPPHSVPDFGRPPEPVLTTALRRGVMNEASLTAGSRKKATVARLKGRSISGMLHRYASEEGMCPDEENRSLSHAGDMNVITAHGKNGGSYEQGTFGNLQTTKF